MHISVWLFWFKLNSSSLPNSFPKCSLFLLMSYQTHSITSCLWPTSVGSFSVLLTLVQFLIRTWWSQGYNRLVKRIGFSFQESLDWCYLLLESLVDLTYKTFRFQFLCVCAIYFIFPEENFESHFNLFVAVPCRIPISCVNFSI